MGKEENDEYIRKHGTQWQKDMLDQLNKQARAEKEENEALVRYNASEDDKFADEKKVQEITDQFIQKIEDMGKTKEEELRRV